MDDPHLDLFLSADCSVNQLNELDRDLASAVHWLWKVKLCFRRF